jgi:hypothetical protein
MGLFVLFFILLPLKSFGAGRMDIGDWLFKAMKPQDMKPRNQQTN